MRVGTWLLPALRVRMGIVIVGEDRGLVRRMMRIVSWRSGRIIKDLSESSRDIEAEMATGSSIKRWLDLNGWMSGIETNVYIGP